MDVYWIADGALKPREIEDLPALLADEDGFTWVDVPEWTETCLGHLAEVFGFHPMALKACGERSHVPRVHAYPTDLFVVLHAPERGDPGHVHLLELDQFIGRNFLVTTHGPLGVGVSPELALRETRGALERIEQGRFSPTSPAELSYVIGSALARRQEVYVSQLADEIALLERRILTEGGEDPEELLEEMFRLRHELLTIATMSGQSHEVYARIRSLSRYLPDEALQFVDDLTDQFERVRTICAGEKEFLQGVLDFYQSRVTTKINVAMERLALLSAVMLPITAVAGIYGMNIIVPDRTDPLHIAGVLLVMGVVTATMLRWAKRHGWW